MTENKPNPKEAMVRRIKALLAKTIDRGATESEAASALEKAQDMMRAHGLDREAIEAEAFVEELFQSKRAVRGFYWGHDLCHGVSLMTGALGFARKSDEITFAGRESDAIFARWLLDLLDGFVTRNAAAYVNQTGGAKAIGAKRASRDDRQDSLFAGMRVQCDPETDLTRRTRIASFGLGVCSRLSERMAKLATNETMERRRQAKTQLMRDGMRLRTGAPRAGPSDKAAFNAGRAAAETAGFHHPVNHGNGVRAIGS